MRESNNFLLDGLDAENNDVEYNEFEGGDLKGLITNPIGRVRALSRGIRKDYPPKVREMLDKIGNKDVRQISIFRQPLSALVDTAMNITSVGQWEKEKRANGYDHYYHLGMILHLEDGSKYLLEKHAVIMLKKAPPLHMLATKFNDTYTVDMKGKSPTVGQLMNNALKQEGEKFFKYNPFNNNCQNFVINVLGASGLLDEGARKFTHQMMPKNLGLAEKIAPAITDLGGLADKALEGEGFAQHNSGSIMREELGGAFFDSFKPANFKRSFNTAMDILSAPAKLAFTATGTGAVLNPVMDVRLKHNGRVSSALRSTPKVEVKQKKDLTDEQRRMLAEHTKHHTRNHINMMTKAMMDGKTFNEAHQLASKYD